MAVKTALSEIAHGALGSSFLNAIKVMYRQAVEGGVFETVESEYEAGVRELNAVFSSEQTDRLAEYEHTCSSIRDYSARYGFLAGLYCGFKHGLDTVQSERQLIFIPTWMRITSCPLPMRFSLFCLKNNSQSNKLL